MYAGIATSLALVLAILAGPVLAQTKINLATQVQGDLPFANLTQGSALSVLGVTGNATADHASIAAGSDHQIFRRSGTAVAFGSINLASSAAVGSTILPTANGGTGVNNAGTITNASNTTITGGGTLALGGFTLTAPATGTVVLTTTNQSISGFKSFATTANDGIKLGDQSWLNSTNLGANWPAAPTGSTLAAWNFMSTGYADGKSPGLFSIRTSTAASGAQYVGLTAVALNDLPAASGANTGYAIYLEAYRQNTVANAATIQGIEIAVINRLAGSLGDGTSLVDPYRNGDGTNGLTEGLRLSNGGFLGGGGGATTYHNSDGLYFDGSGSNRWNAGIVFASTSITTGGDAISIGSSAASAGNRISWYSAAGTRDVSITNDSGSLSTAKYKSTVATGTAPFIVASTTVSTNLNADLLDGYHASNSTASIPISNSTMNTNLFANWAQYLTGKAGDSGSTSANHMYLYWNGSNQMEVWVDTTCIGKMDIGGTWGAC